MKRLTYAAPLAILSHPGAGEIACGRRTSPQGQRARTNDRGHRSTQRQGG
jgi:hypothetical protein